MSASWRWYPTVFLLTACGAWNAAAGTCEREPVAAASTVWIGDDMQLDGRAMVVRALRFDRSARQVEREFQAYWDREGLPSMGTQGTRGRVLSGLDETCQYVLELQAGASGDTAQGLMSAMQLMPAAARRSIPESVAVLPAGRILSDIESRDPGRVGRTWVIALGGRAEDGASRYRGELRREGWKTMVSMAPPPARGARSSDAALAMQRGAYRLDAVFTEQMGQTTAVINVMESR